MMAYVKLVCGECGSEKVSCLAYVVWSAENQKFEVDIDPRSEKYGETIIATPTEDYEFFCHVGDKEVSVEWEEENDG